MPQKLNMIISNGNAQPLFQRQFNTSNLGVVSSHITQYMASPKAPSALNAPFIARIHNVRPGCGSCGRH